MPGIVGIVTKMPREWAEHQLLRMVAALRHEPSYAAGTWSDEAQGLYVGWVARKGSFSDSMPIENERGDVVLTFAGEEYTDPQELSSLKRHGHSFADSASSYLVHLYEEDATFPRELNGQFHGFLADRTRNMAMLFNDRYGMQRIYYHEAKEAFYFAAEAKAILAVRPELRRLNPRGFGEFVACGCVLDNRTLFDEVHALPPGSAWVFRCGKLESKGNYFRAEDWEVQRPLDPEPYYRELRNTFCRILPRYFDAPEPIGMSVTGGLDTRMILACHQPRPASIPCYSFGGTYRESQDVILGRRVAKAWGQPHEVISVADTFLSRFSHYAERTVYLTDGCARVNLSPCLYVSEQAAQIAPIRVTGNYGGEVLRGIRSFKPTRVSSDLFHPGLVSHILSAYKTYHDLNRINPLSFALFRQNPWQHYPLFALEHSQLAVRSPYLDNDLVRTVYQAPKSSQAGTDVSLRLIAEGDATLSAIRTDRGSVGHGSPVRSAQRAILEFTAKSEYAYDYGMPQWVARIDHFFSRRHLERIFLGRHKFYHFRIWYRDALSKYVREVLLDSRALSRPYLERKKIEAVLDGHLRGVQNYTEAIHTLLTVELFHRIFIDSRN